MEQRQSRAASELLRCQCDGFQCLLLCDSCSQSLAALQEPGRGEWCGRSAGSVPCPSERQALCCGQEAFLWFLWFPVFLGRREEATGAQTLGLSTLRVRRAALGGLQCLARCPQPRVLLWVPRDCTPVPSAAGRKGAVCCPGPRPWAPVLTVPTLRAMAWGDSPCLARWARGRAQGSPGHGGFAVAWGFHVCCFGMGLCEGIFYPDSKPMVTATARGEIKTRCTPLSQTPAKPETALWGRIVWEGLGCAALPLLGPGAQRSAQDRECPAGAAGQEWALRAPRPRGSVARSTCSRG